MKHIRNYKSFIKEVHNQVPIIEKQIFSDFSNSIWDMSLRSSIFTTDEKEFIKENLTSYKIDLLKEEFGIKDFFKTVYDNGKKAGGKLFSTIKEKLLKIKEGMKSLISGVVKFFEVMIKKLFNLSQSNVKNITTQFKSPIDKKLVELITQKKISTEDLKGDIGNVKQTTDFLKTKFVTSFSKKVETVDDKVISDAEAEVANIEDELKLESFDILKTFYSVNEEFKVGDMVSYTRDNGETAQKEIVKIDGDTLTFKDKEGNEFTKGADDVKPVKGVSDKILDAKDWFMKWFLDMKETSPPEGGKSKWWMKLVLKIVLLLLAPMKALLTTTIKFVSSNAAKGLSNFVKALGGPGIFEFAALNAVLIGIPNLIDAPTKIIFSQFGLSQLEEPWNLVFKLFVKLISELSGMDMVIKVFGVICLILAVEGIVSSYLSKSGETKETTQEVTPTQGVEQKENPAT
jgi:hypothetical protein